MTYEGRLWLLRAEKRLAQAYGAALAAGDVPLMDDLLAAWKLVNTLRLGMAGGTAQETIQAFRTRIHQVPREEKP